jgi:anti-sigma regulatory factor (Ser/Thr protein kinase)
MTAEAPLTDPPRSAADAAPAGLLLDQRFDADTLHQLRAAVLAHAAQAGLPGHRASDIVLAVHELAANTVRHGAGAGRLLVRTWPGVFQCQVLDAGPASRTGHADGTVHSRPPWPSSEGHGLWLVRQVADQLSIIPQDGGYQVTALFTLPATQG